MDSDIELSKLYMISIISSFLVAIYNVPQNLSLIFAVKPTFLHFFLMCNLSVILPNSFVVEETVLNFLLHKIDVSLSTIERKTQLAFYCLE